MNEMIRILAAELGKDPKHIENVVQLLDEGNTIPFIARYRKELHGAMDDTTLRTLEDRLRYLRGLEKRRGEVKNTIEAQGKLTIYRMPDEDLDKIQEVAQEYYEEKCAANPLFEKIYRSQQAYIASVSDWSEAATAK